MNQADELRAELADALRKLGERNAELIVALRESIKQDETIAKLRARDVQGLRLRGALVAVERSTSLEMARAAATAALDQDTEFRANDT